MIAFRLVFLYFVLLLAASHLKLVRVIYVCKTGSREVNKKAAKEREMSTCYSLSMIYLK